MGKIVNREVDDLKYWKKFSKKVFEYLNGKINPYYLATKITVNDYEFPIVGKREGVDESNLKNASMIVDRIIIFTPDIINFLEKFDDINPERNHYGADVLPVVRGWIVSIIAHELSHVDQKLPWFVRCASGKLADDVRTKFEYDNEMNSELFIDKYRKLLINEFGFFDTTSIRNLVSYKQMAKDLPDSLNFNTYMKIRSPVDKFWDELSSLCLFDMESFIKGCGIEQIEMIVSNPFISNYQVCRIYTEDLYEPETSWSRNNAVDGLRFMSTAIYNVDGLTQSHDISIYHEKDDLHKICIWIDIKAIVTSESNNEMKQSTVYIDQDLSESGPIYKANDALDKWIASHSI